MKLKPMRPRPATDLELPVNALKSGRSAYTSGL